MEYSKIALTIAGSDSGAGAGIQADLKTMSALGVFGTTVITSITAQNTQGVRKVEQISPEIVKAQIDAIFEDFRVETIKIGMIGSPEIANIIADSIERYKPHFLVVDPVMVATSGDSLSEESTVEVIKRRLFPLATVITPNLFETSELLGRKVTTVEEMKEATKDLLQFGSESVLVKGGHLEGKNMVDIWRSRHDETPTVLSSYYITTENTHGTGCTLSSAIASFLTLGKSLPDSISLAKEYITGAIRSGKEQHLGKGHGPVNHFWCTHTSFRTT